MEPVFRLAFDRPTAFWNPEREERVLTEPRSVGVLGLPTGRIAIHDPGYEFAPDRLDRDVPPGVHVVDLVVRSWTGDDGTFTTAAFTAAVRVAVRPGDARRFVPVVSSVNDRELSIGVDSGLVAVFDRALLDRLASSAILDAVPDSAPEGAPGQPPAHIVPAPGGGGIFVCQAGMGDGAYRAWWGLALDGEVVELIVDFGGLEFSLWRTVELPASAFLGSMARLRLALAGTGLELEPVPVASIGIPIGWASPEEIIALRRPAGPLWEFRMLDAGGAVIGGPGLTQLFPGPWFELFEIAKLERSETVRVRIHEGTEPLQPIEP
jgi:hypothetical protein